MTTTTTHSLNCDDAPLAKGVRKERHWSCTCGTHFFGFDSTVKREFTAHRKGA
jgi:hypothetical protein